MMVPYGINLSLTSETLMMGNDLQQFRHQIVDENDKLKK
jgi:hypothetical protein